MKNGFDELISILDMAEGRILEFKDMSTETSKQKSREKRKTNKQKGTEYSNIMGQLQKV